MNKYLKTVAASILMVFIFCSCSSQTGIANSTGTDSTSVSAVTVNVNNSTKAAENKDEPDTPKTDISSNDYATKKLTDTVISKTQYDINNDGKKENIEIVLTDGRFDEDTELWAGNGPKWIGNFIIRVVSGQKVLSSQSLNELMGQVSGDVLFFWAPEFTLELRDYNSDNKIDFNLGQYLSSNGNTYMLFTIDPQGKISKIAENMGSLFISGTGHSNSTDQIVADGKSIKVRFYDNMQGGYIEETYKWDVEKNTFSRIQKEEIKP